MLVLHAMQCAVQHGGGGWAGLEAPPVWPHMLFERRLGDAAARLLQHLLCIDKQSTCIVTLSNCHTPNTSAPPSCSAVLYVYCVSSTAS